MAARDSSFGLWFLAGTGALEIVGRDGGKFTLMLPRGPGAISPVEIERLRHRWRRELGLRSPA